MNITAKFIKEYVEELSDIKLDTKQRNRCIVETRWVAFTLTRDFTNLSLSKIGELYNKDHATVLHGLRSFKELENQLTFMESKNLYEKCLRHFLDMTDDFIGLRKLQTAKELKKEYECRYIRMSDKYRDVIKRLNVKLKNYRSKDIFDKISELPEDDFKELENRVNAFLIMNTYTNKRRNRKKTKNILV